MSYFGLRIQLWNQTNFTFTLDPSTALQDGDWTTHAYTNIPVQPFQAIDIAILNGAQRVSTIGTGGIRGFLSYDIDGYPGASFNLNFSMLDNNGDSNEYSVTTGNPVVPWPAGFQIDQSPLTNGSGLDAVIAWVVTYKP